eukprot:COSAG06_NODE_7767_length_2382_cov_1.723609_1_plen_56_part_10
MHLLHLLSPCVPFQSFLTVCAVTTAVLALQLENMVSKWSHVFISYRVASDRELARR